MRKQPDGNSGAFFCYAEGWIMALKGLPDGFEEVEVGIPKLGDWYLNAQVGPVQCKQEAKNAWLILRKIEKPKQYRPFANAEEFKPHCERWFFFDDGVCKICRYDKHGIWIGGTYQFVSYAECHRSLTFDDGSPFGVEVA